MPSELLPTVWIDPELETETWVDPAEPAVPPVAPLPPISTLTPAPESEPLRANPPLPPPPPIDCATMPPELAPPVEMFERLSIVTVLAGPPLPPAPPRLTGTASAPALKVMLAPP